MEKLKTVGFAAAIFSLWMNVSGSILANHWRRRPAKALKETARNSSGPRTGRNPEGSRVVDDDGYTNIEEYLNGSDLAEFVDYTKPENSRNTLENSDDTWCLSR